jgi:hypothetical protein
MALTPTDATNAAPRGPTAQEVAAYLRAHPEFLIEHPDLMQVLTPPTRVDGETGGRGVVDMQQFMLKRLQGEIDRLKRDQRDLVQTGRGNLAIQARVHAASLALLGATTFDHLIQIVTTDFAVLLDVDVVMLCVEPNGTSVPIVRAAGIQVLGAGAGGRLIGENHDAVLRPDVMGDPAIFGAAAGLVRSDALVRLRVSPKAPPGLLAFGSRRVGAFHPNQGTELLGYLARVLESCMRAWLDLPA